MPWYLILWLVFFAMNFGLLCINFHQLLTLTDLEADHLNPFEAAAGINKWIMHEFLLQALMCILFLLTGHWVMFLMTLPLTLYHVKQFLRREHLIDVTEIFRNLDFEKKYRMIKLGLYLIFFCIFMFRIIAGSILLYNSEGLDFRSSFLEYSFTGLE